MPTTVLKGTGHHRYVAVGSVVVRGGKSIAEHPRS